MSFRLKAIGGTNTADRDEIRRALDILIESGQTFEIRGLPGGRSRICRTLEEGVEAAFDLSDGTGVYWTLNPCRSDLDKAAANPDILCRWWLLVDVDPERDANVSSTDSEKELAGGVICSIIAHLNGLGWPDPIIIDSGNGWHALYRIDLPNTKLAQQLLKSVLVELGRLFDRDIAKVDKSVHNAARISKLPGTWARKGMHSDERPHRMASLIASPKTIEIVSIEQLEALVTKEEKPLPTPPLNGHAFTAKASDVSLDGYIKKAIDGECYRILTAIPGGAQGRNNALNVASFSLGTLAGWPEMGEGFARAELLRAALRAGLGERESEKTIESGWNAGAAKPRERPKEEHRNGTAKAAPVRPGKLTIKGSAIQRKSVKWLWPLRIAVGFISIFAGKTGLGKSFVLCDFAARLTRGDVLPDSSERLAVGRVLMISEDPYEYVLAPRLYELGADLSRVSFLTWEAMASYTLSDIGMLEEAYVEAGDPILVVIDPPANFLGGKDEHKNAEIRQVLMGLVSWLSQKNVACVFITHVNKQSGKGIDAVDRIMGSVAWSSTSRVALAFAPDPNDSNRCLFAGVKNNLGPKARTLAYSIVPTTDLAKVVWMGPVDTTADEAMNQIKRKSVGVCVVEWLEERFREQREWESNELRRLGLDYGFTHNAIFKSGEVNALPIRKTGPHTNANGVRYWVWKAKPGWPSEKRSESSESYESSDVSYSQRPTSELSACTNGLPKVPKDQSSESRKLPESTEIELTKGVAFELSELSEVSDIREITKVDEDAREKRAEINAVFSRSAPWDADLESPEKRWERRRFKIGTWLRNMLWGAPAPGVHVIKRALDSGFTEEEIQEVAKLIDVDVSGNEWVYRGF